MKTVEQNNISGTVEVNRDALPAGDGNPRGAEKPQGFFSEYGAPCTPCAAEKPGGFFSGHPSGEAGESGVGFQPVQNQNLVVAEDGVGKGFRGENSSRPLTDEPEELLEKLASPVPWNRRGRPKVLTPEIREQISLGFGH